MTTTTKRELAAYVAEQVDVKPSVAMRYINTAFDVLHYQFTELRPVHLRGIGKLVPKIKSAGRPVRNPKTGQPMVMRETVSVTFTKSSGPKFNTSDLADWLGECPDFSHAEAERMTKAFVTAMKNALQNEGDRIEIRGFGVFTVKASPKRTARNPKTGETFTKEAGTKLTFKMSKLMRKGLEQCLLQTKEAA